MAIPFPGPGFIPNPPYPITAWVAPSGRYSPAWAWRQTPAPTAAFYTDQTSLQTRAATINSNDGKTLTITAAGGSKSFNIAGDGTANIPVGIIIP